MPDLLRLGDCISELHSEQPIEETETFVPSVTGMPLHDEIFVTFNQWERS